jgi:hypothetical protein
MKHDKRGALNGRLRTANRANCEDERGPEELFGMISMLGSAGAADIIPGQTVRGQVSLGLQINLRLAGM